MPEGTPHYPGFHNFWSNDWVADEYSKPEPAVLGDVTPRRRPYNKGVGFSPLPDGAAVGSPDCIQSGDIYPPSPGRTILGGFDSRCYSWYRWICLAYWLRNDEISSLADFARVPVWPDFSPSINPEVSTSPPITFKTTFGLAAIPGVQVATNGLFFAGVPMTAGRSVSIYMVATATGFGHLFGPSIKGAAVANGDTFNVLLNSVRYTDSHNALAYNSGNIGADPHLFRIRKDARGFLTLAIDGTVVMTVANNPLGSVQILGLGVSHASSPLISQSVFFEVLCFDCLFSDAQDKDVTDYLLAKFAGILTPPYVRFLYSLQFDGIAGYLDCQTPLVGGTPGNLTIMGWMLRNATGDSISFGWGDVFNNLFQVLWYLDGNVYWYTGNGGLVFAYCPLAGVGWHHFALCFSPGAITVYIDGVAQAVTQVGAPPATYAVTGNFRIALDIASGIFGKGNAVEMFVSPVTLSAGQVAAVYSGATHPDSLAPNGLWRMLEGAGTTVADMGSGHNTGVLTGGGGSVVWSSNVP